METFLYIVLTVSAVLLLPIAIFALMYFAMNYWIKDTGGEVDW